MLELQLSKVLEVIRTSEIVGDKTIMLLQHAALRIVIASAD